MGLDTQNEELGKRWKLYHGVAASDLLPGTRRIEVIVGELLPLVDGVTKATEFVHAPSVKNEFDPSVTSSTVKTKNTITADYLGSNNLSIPDIVMGEEVWIYNFTGTDNYYWKPKDSTGSTGKYLRNGEHIRIVVASKTEPEALTDDNCWFIEIDTRPGTRKFKFSSSSVNGEACRYSLEIDALKGYFEFGDDKFNKLSLASLQHLWVLTNMFSTIRMDKGQIRVQADDSLFLSGNKIFINANELEANVFGPTTVTTEGPITMKSTGLDITGEIKLQSILRSEQHITVAGQVVARGTVTASEFIKG